MAICSLKHVKKNYMMGETVTPLKDINLDINEGDFISIEGPSGMGKSTLLYVIGTLLSIDEGEMFIDGKNVNEMSDDEKTDLRAKMIGFLFQDSNMIQALTLKENLEFTEGIIRGNETSRATEMLERLGLSDRTDFMPHQLSGGQKRRAMLARAIINSPRLILADEPTNDLDEYWSEQVIGILKDEANKGTAVVLVTHNDKWAKYADRRYRLDEGILKEL